MTTMEQLQEASQVYDLYETAMDLIPPDCRACPEALDLGYELAGNVQTGDMAPDQANLEYDLRLGVMCRMGIRNCDVSVTPVKLTY
jgi:hypothetical protein